MLRPDFIYKPKRKINLPIKSNRPKFAAEPNQLTGSVNGMPASDIEERFFKAAVKRSRNLYFRMSLGGPRGTPGWLELDYLLETDFGWWAIEVDDISFVHKGEGERQEALLKDLRRLQSLKEFGIDLPEVTHITNEQLSTQDDANRWVKDNL